MSALTSRPSKARPRFPDSWWVKLLIIISMLLAVAVFVLAGMLATISKRSVDNQYMICKILDLHGATHSACDGYDLSTLTAK